MSEFSSKAEKIKYQNGIWQYLMDHARPINSGYKIFFVADNKEDFFRWAKARIRGNYSRADIKDMEHKRFTQMKDYYRLKGMYSRRMSAIDTLKNGNLLDKAIAHLTEKLEDLVKSRSDKIKAKYDKESN